MRRGPIILDIAADSCGGCLDGFVISQASMTYDGLATNT
jgi:hypothetical protein